MCELGWETELSLLIYPGVFCSIRLIFTNLQPHNSNNFATFADHREISGPRQPLWLSGNCLVICRVQHCPNNCFSRVRCSAPFNASIKLGYTSDDPAHSWKRNIHLREIYCSLECDTKAISVAEIGRHEKSFQQGLEPIQRQCILVLWPHCLFSLVRCSSPRHQSHWGIIVTGQYITLVFSIKSPSKDEIIAYGVQC